MTKGAKGERTRATIVEATSELLRRQGYAATGLNQIIEDVAVLVHPACEHAFVKLELSLTCAPVFVEADLESLRPNCWAQPQ